MPTQRRQEELRDRVADLLHEAKGPDGRGWYTAVCPFHDDHHPSLRFTETGFICMVCGRKGPLRELARERGIEVEMTRSERHRQRNNGGLTLEKLAAAKGLPLEFLRHELSWHDVEYRGRPAVAIPCFNTGGNVLREQLRIRLGKGAKKDNRFVWDDGSSVWPLGLDSLKSARQAGYLLIVEGATDYAACVLARIPVLGVPGSNTWHKEWAGFIRDIARIVVWREPGQGGATLIELVAGSLPDSTEVAVVVAPPGAKDPCELRQMDHTGFAERMAELIAGAVPPDLGGPSDQPERSSVEATSSRRSAGDRAIEYVLAADVGLIHDQHWESFIAFRNHQHRREIWPLKSKVASEFIRWRFYLAEEKGLTGEALATAKGFLAAKARFDGARRDLNVRVAFVDGTVWYDLGDWRAVAITRDGWRVVDDPPILFRHYPHQVPQVEPVEGGSLREVLTLLNLRDDHSRLLLLVYLVAALLSGIPLPVLVVHGEQGSAKTFCFGVLRGLIDPSSLRTLSHPDNLRDFVQIAAHHRTVYLDNLTSLPDWLSDALCRLCTGDGFSKRELYTDDDDVV